MPWLRRIILIFARNGFYKKTGLKEDRGCLRTGGEMGVYFKKYTKKQMFLEKDSLFLTELDFL